MNNANKNKPKQTRSEFIPKGAEIPTGEILGILKPGTKQRQLPLFSAIPQVECRNEPSVRDHSTAFIGEVPSALNPPAGCAFGPRCPLADNNCTKHIPNLEEKGDSEGHFVACWNRKIRKNEVRT